MRHAKFFLLGAAPFVLLYMLSACALLGVPQPQSINERLALAYASHTAVLESATNSVNSGDLTAAEGEQIEKLADESRVLLDGTRAAIAGGDTSTAAGKLQLGMSILTELQLYLRSR